MSLEKDDFRKCYKIDSITPLEVYEHKINFFGNIIEPPENLEKLIENNEKENEKARKALEVWREKFGNS